MIIRFVGGPRHNQLPEVDPKESPPYGYQLINFLTENRTLYWQYVHSSLILEDSSSQFDIDSRAFEEQFPLLPAHISEEFCRELVYAQLGTVPNRLKELKS